MVPHDRSQFCSAHSPVSTVTVLGWPANLDISYPHQPQPEPEEGVTFAATGHVDEAPTTFTTSSCSSYIDISSPPRPQPEEEVTFAATGHVVDEA